LYSLRRRGVSLVSPVQVSGNVINFVERKNGIARSDKARVIRQFTLRTALASTLLTSHRFAERRARVCTPTIAPMRSRARYRARCVRFVDRKAALETAPGKYYIGHSSRRTRSRKRC
jgi:hypothetical protein